MLNFITIIFTLMSINLAFANAHIADEIIESILTCNIARLNNSLNKSNIDLSRKLKHSKFSEEFYLQDYFLNTKCSSWLWGSEVSYIDFVNHSIKQRLDDVSAHKRSFNNPFDRKNSSPDRAFTNALTTCNYNKLDQILNENPQLVNEHDNEGFSPLAKAQQVICPGSRGVKEWYSNTFKLTKYLIGKGADLSLYSKITPNSWSKTIGPWFFNAAGSDALGDEAIQYISKLVSTYDLDLSLRDFMGRSLLSYLQVQTQSIKALSDFDLKFIEQKNQLAFNKAEFNIYLPNLNISNLNEKRAYINYFSKNFNLRSKRMDDGNFLRSYINKLGFSNKEDLKESLRLLDGLIGKHPQILNSYDINTGKTSLMTEMYYLCPRIKPKTQQRFFLSNSFKNGNLQIIYEWLKKTIRNGEVNLTLTDKKGRTYLNYALHYCPNDFTKEVFSKLKSDKDILKKTVNKLSDHDFFNGKTLYRLDQDSRPRFLNGDIGNLNYVKEIASEDYYHLFKNRLNHNKNIDWLTSYKNSSLYNGLGLNVNLDIKYKKRVVQKVFLTSIKPNDSTTESLKLAKPVDQIASYVLRVNDKDQYVRSLNNRVLDALHQKYFDYFLEASRSLNSISLDLTLKRKKQYLNTNLLKVIDPLGSFELNKIGESIDLGTFPVGSKVQVFANQYSGRYTNENTKKKINLKFTSDSLSQEIDYFRLLFSDTEDFFTHVDYGSIHTSISTNEDISKIGKLKLVNQKIELNLNKSIKHLQLKDSIILAKLTQSYEIIGRLVVILNNFVFYQDHVDTIYEDILHIAQMKGTSAKSKHLLLSSLIKRCLITDDNEMKCLEHVTNTINFNNQNEFQQELYNSLKAVFLGNEIKYESNLITGKILTVIYNNFDQIRFSKNSHLKNNIKKFLMKVIAEKRDDKIVENSDKLLKRI